MFDDIAIAVKRTLQQAELAVSPMTAKLVRKRAANILEQATATHEQLLKFDSKAAQVFDDAIQDFAKKALKEPTAGNLYAGLDRFKAATADISQFAKGATGDMSIGAAAAAKEARSFGASVKVMLEDAEVFGEAGVHQHAFNASYTKVRRAEDAFEKQFASAKAKGQVMRVLDGAKTKKWSRDITNQSGEVRNAVVDDLVSAQTELINLTNEMAKREAKKSRAALGSAPAEEAAASVLTQESANVLSKSLGEAQNLASAKQAASTIIDRAEVLQGTQNAILSRQGAGVNPLPVELFRKLGGGALLGGAVGGLPGAIVGGGVSSVLQKYGAITSNPKSAIEFLNKIESIRGVQKEQVSSWIKATLGETEGSGARAIAANLARKVDGKRVGDGIRAGAESLQSKLPAVREVLGSANKTAARKILETSTTARAGIESLASRADSASAGLMERLLPAVGYASVKNSSPEEWWARTQKKLIAGQTNPQSIIDEIEKETAGISEDLPELAGAIGRQQLNVVGYLTDRMPRNPRPYMLGDKSWTPSPSEMKTFRDLVLVATNPDALLPLITVGTATRAQVDAVKTLWPKTWQETRQQVIDAVTSAAADERPVPYQARLRLGQVLQVPMDASQYPAFVQWMQKPSAALAEEDQAGAPAPTVKSNFSLNSDKNLPFSALTAARK